MALAWVFHKCPSLMKRTSLELLPQAVRASHDLCPISAPTSGAANLMRLISLDLSRQRWASETGNGLTGWLIAVFTL